MTNYELIQRRDCKTPEEVDVQIDLLKAGHNSTVDESVRKDCAVKLAICSAIRLNLTQRELFSEVAA